MPRGQRVVVELVNPKNPDSIKRLDSDMDIEEAGIENGAIMRFYLESVAGAPPELLTINTQNVKIVENPTVIHIRIIEEPLIPHNIASILTAISELYTKYWLVANIRYADLIEYMQTHDPRFAKEAGATIAWATYNSPFNFGIQLDKLVPSAAEAFITVIDGITQRKPSSKN